MESWLTPVPGEFNRHPLIFRGSFPIFSNYLLVALGLMRIFGMEGKNVLEVNWGEQGSFQSKPLYDSVRNLV